MNEMLAQVAELTDEEVQTILLKFGTVRGGKGFTEAEAQELLAWARNTRFAAAMLQCVLMRGTPTAAVTLTDGEIEWVAFDQEVIDRARAEINA